MEPPTPDVQRRMTSQRRKDTAPEIRIRRGLFRKGFRYRCGYPVPGRARRTIDIAFTRWRVAVFIDGCFWHGCPEHFVPPRANAAWWRAKIEANRRRDAETTQLLLTAGWRVVRLWEHTPTDDAIHDIQAALDETRRSR